MNQERKKVLNNKVDNLNVPFAEAIVPNYLAIEKRIGIDSYGKIQS